MLKSRRLGAALAIAGVATIGIMALPGKAEAWWRGGYCCGVGFGVVVPPVVVAPPYYAPAPVYRSAGAHVLTRRRLLTTRRSSVHGYRRTGRAASGCPATGADRYPSLRSVRSVAQ